MAASAVGNDIRPFDLEVVPAEVDKGGHFDACDEPELFTYELRAALTSLR